MKVDNNLSVEGDVEFAKSGTAYPTLRLVSTSHAATPAVKFYTNTSDNDGEKLHFQLARANTSGLATIGYNSIGTFSTTMYGAVHMQPDFGSNCALNVNGNIGIGTASPSAPLNVETTTAGTQTMISISSDEGMTAVPGTNNLFGIAFEDVGGANHVGHIGLAFDGTTTNMHFGGLYHSGYNAWTDQLMTIKGNGNVGIGTTNPGDLSVAGAIASTLEIAGNYGRTAHHIGGFVGGYNNIANNSTKSNPIYVIGSNYQPTDAALSNMYGIGYTHTNASFIDNTDGGWGMYVAAAGDARIWLAASDGTDSYFNAGNIAIGTTGSLSLLHIQQSTDNDDGGIRLYNVQDGTYWSQVVNTSEYLYFNYNGGSYGGYIKNNVNVGQIDFTGQHRNSISTGTVNEHTGSIGYIVCADGTYDNLWDNNDNVKQDVKPNINESLPKVKLSNTAYDKTVFGVISELENNYQNTNVSESFTYNESGERILTQTTSSVYVREYNQGSFTSTMEAEDSNDQKLIINSLGEGAIWVSNYSGSLENGDYITSSPIQGLGMKQDDDLLHNYTVAKITQDCTFDMNASASYDAVEFEWSGSNYKRAFVGCTYHCG